MPKYRITSSKTYNAVWKWEGRWVCIRSTPSIPRYFYRQLETITPKRFHGGPFVYLPISIPGAPAGTYSYVVLP